MLITNVNCGEYLLLALLVNEVREATGEDCGFGYSVGNNRGRFDVAWPCAKVALDIKKGNEYIQNSDCILRRVKKHSEAANLGWVVFYATLNNQDSIGEIIQSISNIIVNRRRNNFGSNIETKTTNQG